MKLLKRLAVIGGGLLLFCYVHLISWTTRYLEGDSFEIGTEGLGNQFMNTMILASILSCIVMAVLAAVLFDEDDSNEDDAKGPGRSDV